MLKYLCSAAIVMIVSSTSFSQVLDSLGVISPGNEIRDLAFKGGTMYAAVGEGGVMYSNDEGYTWTACSPFPDNGFGVESAFSILVASDGDLIIGGNQLFNGAPLGRACFRSSDDGATWSAVVIDGYAGYEQSGEILELSDGGLIMMGGFQKLFISSLSDETWTQTTAPGGIIYGFELINDEVFVVNNPAAGTAGTWTSTDLGASWQRYGGNGTPVGSGTVTTAPILQSGAYKFIGIGGTFGSRGVFRSGVNDTLWVEKNNGIGESGIYPICMATDHVTNWMIIQNQSGTCKFTETADFGDNWTPAVSGLPSSGGSAPCPEKLLVFGTHLYAYSRESIYRMADVAVPVSVGESQLTDEAISLFPNPVRDKINLVFDGQVENGKWSILNLHGQVLHSGSYSAVANGAVSLDARHLGPGAYLINITVGEYVRTFKFNKE